MRLLLIEGNYVAVYERRTRLAVFMNAEHLDMESAEQLRRVPTKTLLEEPIEQKQEEPHDAA